MVVAWIFNSLNKDLQNNISFYDEAHEIWKDLEERFLQSNVPRIHEIKCEISLAHQEDLFVSAYYTKVKRLWDELGTYSKVPQCTCGATKELVSKHDTKKLHQFLMGLNDNYGMERLQILNMELLPNLSKAYALVAKEEKQLKIANS
ncbi:uncharacterized protein LOC127788190 [Diospyros lotus]|uniref:uncharacterized protein LOC127788190 n=1 Tax=Diospyros lotus TaxID=55363 RepID=UPI00225B2AA9|nr:uncharacterized protein LOC127788190 [Diospyros lotus]